MLVPVALFASLALLQQVPPAAQVPASTPMPVQGPAEASDTQTATRAGIAVTATPTEPAQTCRTEAVTGSRFGRRVCRSNVQTAEEAAQSREMLRRLQGARMPDS